MNSHIKLFVAATAVLSLAACSSMDMGSQAAKTEATGSAGGANSQNANSKLARWALSWAEASAPRKPALC